MIQIDCSNCNGNCCHNQYLTPILLPAEEESFREFLEEIPTPDRIMHVLRKFNGNCLLFDRNAKKCTAYDKRPLECKIYPFLLDFSGQNTNVKLDKRFCQSLQTLNCNLDKLINLIQGFIFPQDWIKGYESLQGFY